MGIGVFPAFALGCVGTWWKELKMFVVLHLWMNLGSSESAYLFNEFFFCLKVLEEPIEKIRKWSTSTTSTELKSEKQQGAIKIKVQFIAWRVYKSGLNFCIFPEKWRVDVLKTSAFIYKCFFFKPSITFFSRFGRILHVSSTLLALNRRRSAACDGWT